MDVPMATKMREPMDRPLKIGDTVRWKGCWGEAQEKLAVVTGMETRCIGKYGQQVPEAPWRDIKAHGVVNLDNGHWAYGYQIDPVVDNN